MAQELRLKINDEPTWFNKEMAIGTLLFPIVGTFIGGWIGKNRMENEKLHGRPVSDTPSTWNKDTLLGGLIGSFLSFPIARLTAQAAGTAAGSGNPVLGTIGLVLSIAISIGGLVAGFSIGSKVGRKRQEREYEEARRQQIVQHLSENVSPEIGQAVEYRMEHDKQWAKQALEEKLLQAAQEQRR